MKKEKLTAYLLIFITPREALEPAVVGHVGVHAFLAAGNLACISTTQPEIHVNSSTGSCRDEIGVSDRFRSPGTKSHAK